MRNIGSYIAPSLTICLLLLVSFSKIRTIKPIKDSSQDIAMVSSRAIESQPVGGLVLPTIEPHVTYTPTLGKTFVGFKEAVGFKESRGNYFIVNSYGYLGKYQFGEGTLKLIGIYNPNEFLKNPELQEKAFIANAERNKWILRKDIKRFNGMVVNGVTVTESGILAAAHLAGPGNVKKYLRSYGSNNFADAFGTSISYYMKRFSGYDTSEIIANKKAKVKRTI